MKKSIVALLICSAVAISQPAVANPKGKGKGKDDKPTLVVTQTVAQQQVVQSLSLVGKLQAQHSVVISPETVGRVKKILVKANQQVKKGQTLVVLDTSSASLAVKEAELSLQEERRVMAEYNRLAERKAITQTATASQKAKVNIAQVRLDSAKHNLDNLYIKAPFNGTLGFIDFSRGKMVSTGSELLTLDDMSVMHLDLQVPDKYLSQLKMGMPVTAHSSAWADEFEGQIIAIDSRINAETLNAKVRVNFDNSDRRLKPGMLMHSKIEFTPLIEPIIPVQALEYAGTKRYVYVINAENKAIKTEVKLGARVENKVIIDQGLEIGERIVVQGIVNMRDNISVIEKGEKEPKPKAKQTGETEQGEG